MHKLFQAFCLSKQTDVCIFQQATSLGSIWKCLIAPVSLLVRRPAIWGGGGAVCGPVSASAAPLQQQHGRHPEPSLCHPLPPHEIQFWSHQCKSSNQLSDPESTEKVNVKHWLRKCLQGCNLLLPLQRKQLSMLRENSLCLNLHPKMNIETDECSVFHVGVSIKTEWIDVDSKLSSVGVEEGRNTTGRIKILKSLCYL